MFHDITHNYNTLPDLSRRILMKRIAYFISGISLFPDLLYASELQEQNKTTTSNEDLSTFQNFIEIVIPGISGKNVIFVLDIDSDQINSFSGIDKKYLEMIVKLLIDYSDC